MSDPVNCTIGMIPIPAGTYERGSFDGNKDERPVRQIYVSAFCSDKHGVTNEQWGQYLTKTQNPNHSPSILKTASPGSTSVPACDQNTKTQRKPLLNSANPQICGLGTFLSPQLPSPKGFDGPNQPVVKVSWDEADRYCKSLGKRLPTEAERERMAKGPSGKDEYGTPTGQLQDNQGKKLAHYSERSTANVCSYPTNGFNLCDVSGNTWEWTSDWYGEKYYQNSPTRDPKGPESGEHKVLRGGAWYFYNSQNLRSSKRNFNHTSLRTWGVGFRCVSDVKK